MQDCGPLEQRCSAITGLYHSDCVKEKQFIDHVVLKTTRSCFYCLKTLLKLSWYKTITLRVLSLWFIILNGNIYNKTDNLLSLQIYLKKQTLRPNKAQTPLKSSYQYRYKEMAIRFNFYELTPIPININYRLHAHEAITLHTNIHRLEEKPFALLSLIIKSTRHTFSKHC